MSPARGWGLRPDRWRSWARSSRRNRAVIRARFHRMARHSRLYVLAAAVLFSTGGVVPWRPRRRTTASTANCRRTNRPCWSRNLTIYEDKSLRRVGWHRSSLCFLLLSNSLLTFVPSFQTRSTCGWVRHAGHGRNQSKMIHCERTLMGFRLPICKPGVIAAVSGVKDDTLRTNFRDRSNA